MVLSDMSDVSQMEKINSLLSHYLGFFFGLAFLAATFTSMAVFSGYTLMGQSQLAAIVFSTTDICQYLVASTGCLCALWQMRLLRYHKHIGVGVPNGGMNGCG